MIRFLAVAVAAALIAAPEFAVAQGKGDERPISASRFGISVDGVDVAKQKKKGLKAPGSKQRSGPRNYKMQNAWPQKGY